MKKEKNVWESSYSLPQTIEKLTYYKKKKENPLLMDKKDGKGEKMTNFPKRTFWYVDKRNVENLLNVVEDEEGFYSKAFYFGWKNGGICPKNLGQIQLWIKN